MEKVRTHFTSVSYTHLDVYKRQHLDRAETEKYIQSHLAYAGIIDRELFSRRAIDDIFRLSCGIPRLINRICEKSLMYGCQQNLRIIDDQDVVYVSEHEMLKGGESS